MEALQNLFYAVVHPIKHNRALSQIKYIGCCNLQANQGEIN